jgi:hypothetical protein
MESLLDRSNGLLNPQQPLKVDDRQNLFTSTLGIGAVDHINQSNGAGLNHTVQSAIDKWAGKQAIDITSPSNSPIANSNLSKSAGISVVQAPVTKQYHSALAALIKVAPAAIKIPADIAPTGLVINGVKSSYDVGSTLSIDPSFVVDGDGWKDVSKVAFWLTDSKGTRVELADATSFVAKDPKDNNSAKFSYSTNLNVTTVGDYKLNAIAYDKFGAKSNQFTQAIAIKPINIAPQAPIITGIKSSYETNSILRIDSGSVSDVNGWQDVSKVSFSLTDSFGKTTELASINNNFSSQNINSAKFNYAANLIGFSAGNYQLKAIAYDKAAIASSPFTQSLTIKPLNIAPQAPIITGINSSYKPNSTLIIDSGLVSDENGWQDISKIDFWLTDAKGKRIELNDVTTFTPFFKPVAKLGFTMFGDTIKSNPVAKFSYSVSLNGIATGDYKLNAVTFDKSEAKSNTFTQSLNIKYEKFRESTAINTQTQWAGLVFGWDINQGKPPVDLFREGYNSPNAIAELDLGSNDLGNGKQGINFNLGQGALRDNNRLPVDGFAVRAYTQASFDGGEYKFQVRGDDGFQIFAKNIVTGQWIFITPQDQWQSAYGSHQEITATLPQGRYDLHFHYFEGGGDANFNLGWSKVEPTPPPPPLSNPDINIRLFFNGNFTTDQKSAIQRAAQNWDNIITNDMVSGGVLNINVVDGNMSNDRDHWAETSFPVSIGQIATPRNRTNLSGQYNATMTIRRSFLDGPQSNLLTRLATHELGHALYLDEATYDGILGNDGIMNPRPLPTNITEGIYQRLEYLGYSVNRNPSLQWY